MRSDIEYGSQSGQPLPQEALSDKTKSASEDKRSPGSPTASGAQRWQVRYDKLKFEKKLGDGAYGEVYEGSYKKGKVAIKVYDFRGELTKDQQAEIIKEADLMEGLRSEYLVGFRGICLDQRYCLVMEYCEGGTLRARLNQSQCDISPLEQLQWAKQISYGLYQLHSVRILHRDLKGENILLDKHSDAKVADFGLSVVKSNSTSQSKKGGGAGTIPWMAPELHEDKPNTRETDVYSLGMVLWEIISRQIPFAGIMVGSIISKTLRGQRETFPEQCPEVFRLMITACWDAEPKKRPTAEAVGDQFDAVLKTLESVPASISEPASSPEKKLESSRAPALASLAKLTRFKPSSPPAGSVPVEVSPAVQPAKNPTKDELLQLRDEVAALKLKQAQEELRRQEIQKQEAEKKKTPPSLEPKKLSQNIYTTLPAPKPVAKPVDEKNLSQLLKYVAEGEQDKAEEMIKKDPNLLLSAGTVTDLSSREFKQITAFQYALWALDWHMWEMIRKYLPMDAQAEQFNALESKGTAHGQHFSLQPLIGELQIYVDNADKVWKYDQRATEHWCKKVGGQQRLLPVHVVDEYCHPTRSFAPCPEFKEQELPRNRACEVWDGSRYIKGEWFTSKYNGGLGDSFAFVRGRAGVARQRAVAGRDGWAGWMQIIADLHSLQSLSKTRTQQLELLASQLKSTSLSMGMKG